MLTKTVIDVVSKSCAKQLEKVLLSNSNYAECMDDISIQTLNLMTKDLIPNILLYLVIVFISFQSMELVPFLWVLACSTIITLRMIFVRFIAIGLNFILLKSSVSKIYAIAELATEGHEICREVIKKEITLAERYKGNKNEN